MKKSRMLRAVCLVLCVVFLCGCGTANAVEELLRAPQLSRDTKSLQNALDSHLGESVQLRYPNEGDFLTPYFFGDWDGDGEQDAAVLYQASDSANVQLAVLKRDKSWRVVSTAEGLSPEVDSVQLASMKFKGGTQIIVGYTTASDRYLAVYDLKEDQLEIVLQQPYTQYLVEDITGDRRDDLVVLSRDSGGKTQVQVLLGSRESFMQLPLIKLPEEQFSGYASLAAGRGAKGGQFLVIDGWTGINGQNLASAMFRYDAKRQRMIMAKLPGTTNLYENSIRYVPCLTSRDLDRDGVVEIPVQDEETGSVGATQDERYSFVRWMDFTKRASEESFGVLLEAYGVYIQLPLEWENNVQLAVSENGILELYNLTGDQLLLQLRVTDEPGVEGWRTIGLAASHRIQARTGLRPDEFDLIGLRNGVYVL